MARTVTGVLLIIAIISLVGCTTADSGVSQIAPKAVGPKTDLIEQIDTASSDEISLVEQVTLNRNSYRDGLQALIKFYTESGNNLKLGWAKKELDEFETVPKYRFLLQASIAGPQLKATTSIKEADDLYYSALLIEDKAKKMLIMHNDNLLRIALEKYNELIEKHPASDKIDDAAYRAATIYEHFKDYTIAVLYYQRTYQWDPDTSYPAKYKAAYLMDRKLSRMQEALELYKMAVNQKELPANYKEFAQIRIAEITASEQKKLK